MNISILNLVSDGQQKVKKYLRTNKLHFVLFIVLPLILSHVVSVFLAEMYGASVDRWLHNSSGIPELSFLHNPSLLMLFGLTVLMSFYLVGLNLNLARYFMKNKSSSYKIKPIDMADVFKDIFSYRAFMGCVLSLVFSFLSFITVIAVFPPLYFSSLIIIMFPYLITRKKIKFASSFMGLLQLRFRCKKTFTFFSAALSMVSICCVFYLTMSLLGFLYVAISQYFSNILPAIVEYGSYDLSKAFMPLVVASFYILACALLDVFAIALICDFYKKITQKYLPADSK